MLNTIRLRKGEFLRLGRGGGRVLEGTAWATVSGHADDYIRTAGMSFPCCFDSVLIEAISDELVVESGDSRQISLRNIA